MTSTPPLPWDPAEAGERPSAMFDRLAAVLYAASDYTEVYQAIVTAAVSLVDGCDHASVMVIQPDGAFATAACTDEVARAVDDLERKHLEGPCVDAVLEEGLQLEPDLSKTTQWPLLVKDILATTSVRSVAGFRIIVDGAKVGALDLFSDSVGGLDVRSADNAIVLAAFAGVAISALRGQEEARTLSVGLASNREIGKAVGLLMAFHKVSDVEAFEILKRASQDMNMKLALVAREVVDHHNQGHPPPPEVVARTRGA